MNNSIKYIFFYWLVISLAIPQTILSFTEDMCIWGRMANFLIPTGIIGMLITLSRNPGFSTLWMLPFTIVAAFQDALLSIFGYGIISVDMFLNLMTTNPGEARELLGNLPHELVTIFIIYGIPLMASPLLIYYKATLPPFFLKRNRKVAFCMTAAGLLSAAMAYLFSPVYSVFNDLYPVNIGYNVYLAGKRIEYTARQPEESAGYSYNVTSTHTSESPEIYIAVIGETSRADNWQLNGYDRPTNPRLSKIGNLLYAPFSYSESNITHKSVPMLLTPLAAEDYGDLYKVKSFISAFKEAGFNTAFLSSQLPNHSYVDLFAEEADTTLFVRKGMPGVDRFNDMILIDPIRRILDKKNPRQLIVVHSYGSHFNYHDRYDRNEATFLPDNYKNTDREYAEELRNAYDNTLIATDHFLDSVISLLDDRNVISALVFTSDHGEDLYDNGETFLHASPLPSKMQLHVPMLIWLSDEYKSRFPHTESLLRENMKKRISSSRSYCPTLLGLSGITTERVDSASDLSASCYKPGPRFYLNDHDVAVPWSRIRFK